MDAFEQYMSRALEQRALAHLIEFFPLEMAKLDDEARQRWVSDGIRRSRNFDFVLERDIYKFLDLLAALGPDFDVRFEWASQILSEREESESDDRMARLLEAADEQLRAEDHG